MDPRLHDGAAPSSTDATDQGDGFDALVVDAAPHPDADAMRALAAARQRVLGVASRPRIGRYALGALLGAGGMGRVFRARDGALDRDVAIKVIRSGSATPNLLVEARALARLSHPNIVAIFDVGEADDHGGTYIVMELVHGQTLAAWLSTAPDAAGLITCFTQIARGLAVAHAAGIVHGDIKPGNVMIADDGCPKIVDFGLARSSEAGISTLDGSSPVTLRGGTPRYMAPELVAGGSSDARSDQYAFCVALRDAWRSQPTKVAAVSRLIARGLDERPERRWPSMDALGDALAAIQRRRRAGATAVAAMGALLPWLSVGAPQAVTEAPCPGFEGGWTDARRQALATAFVDVERPWGPQVSRYVAERIDARTAAIATAWEQACAVDAAERDRSQRCLAAVDAELGAAVDILVAGPAPVLLRATSILLAIPDAGDCPGGAGAAAPGEVRARWMTQLAEGHRAVDDGDAQGAGAIAAVVQDEATRADDRGFVARARWLAGVAQRAAGDPRAVATLAEAIDTAEAAGATGVALLASLDRATVMAEAGRVDEAGAGLRAALALAEQLAESDLARARVLSAQASLDRSAARLELATDANDEAASIYARTVGPHHPYAAVARITRGGIAAVRGDAATAEAEYCAAEATYLAATDPSDVGAIDASTRCAVAVLHTDTPRAKRGMLDALARMRARGGPATVKEATLLMHLGIAEKVLGDAPAAIARHLEADAVFGASGGDDHPGRVALLGNLGSALLRNGEPERAEDAYVRAAVLASTVLGDAHPHTAAAWIGLAEVRIALGLDRAAIEAAERALAILSSAGTDASKLAEAQTILAEALVAARQDPDRARGLAQAALASFGDPPRQTKGYQRVVTVLRTLAQRSPRRDDR